MKIWWRPKGRAFCFITRFIVTGFDDERKSTGCKIIYEKNTDNKNFRLIYCVQKNCILKDFRNRRVNKF